MEEKKRCWRHITCRALVRRVRDHWFPLINLKRPEGQNTIPLDKYHTSYTLPVCRITSSVYFILSCSA